MSDFRNSAPSDLPPATIYDPADDESTPFGAEPTGTVVLLLASATDREWAARTAVQLSTEWSRNGRRIVLADLHLEDPLLHDAVGAENLEGIVDVFLYGASIARSARPVRGRGFYLIPAGTYTSDVGALYRHPRWPKLVAGFRDAGASLVLFAPVQTVDAQAAAAWVDQVILLGDPPASGALAAFRAGGAELRGLIVPPERDAAPRAPLPSPAAPLSPESAPALEAQPASRDSATLHLPPPPTRPEKRSQRAVLVAMMVVLAVAVVALVGFLIASRRPDLLPWAGVAAPAVIDSTRTAAAARSAPRALGEPLPYSVQVVAYQSMDPARQQLQSLASRFDDVLFFISPEDENGVVYYKILAGALRDTAAAHQLRDRLTSAGVIEREDAIGDWALIRSVPMAFALRELPTRDAARAAADSMLAGSLPAYALPVPYSDSTRRWQVYGGAYADSTGAEGMRRLLASAGLEARLTPRRGAAEAAPE